MLKAAQLQVKQLSALQQLELLEAMHVKHSVQQDGTLHSDTAANGHKDHEHDPLLSQQLGNTSGMGSVSVGDKQEPGSAEDIAAFGRLMVQLYRGRMLPHHASDHRCTHSLA